MRKLLQNKAVVACLAVVAVLSVGYEYIQPNATQTIVAAARSITPTTEAALVTHAVRPPLRVEGALIRWQTELAGRQPIRDPFVRQVLSAGRSTTNSTDTFAPTLVVQAISHDGGKALAVVNRRVVGPGDEVAGYRVEEILPTQVRLRGPAGDISIPIRRGEKSATGK